MPDKFELNDTTPAAPAGRVNVEWQHDESGNVSAHVAEGGGGGGHQIQDENDTPLPQRSKLAFAGSGVFVIDDEPSDRSIVTVYGSQFIQSTTHPVYMTNLPVGTTLAAVSAMGTANRIYVQKVVHEVPFTVVRLQCWCQTAGSTAGAKGALGVYDAYLNLKCATPPFAIDSGATTRKGADISPGVLLPAGVYFYAWAADSGTGSTWGGITLQNPSSRVYNWNDSGWQPTWGWSLDNFNVAVGLPATMTGITSTTTTISAMCITLFGNGS